MSQASRDQNSVPTLLGVSNVDGTTPTTVYVDPVTHRMLVDLPAAGTVTSVSVTSANGFAGTVATATTTPAITLSTTVTGVIKGNGTAISAATAGTDYIAPAVSTVGNLIFVDATYDIGASGATRPRNIYASGTGIFGGALTSGSDVTIGAGGFSLVFSGRGVISPSADGIFSLQNAAGTSFSRLQFGGTSSSFPAIKRTTTALNFRLADDSADTAFTASTGTLSAPVTAAGSIVTTDGSQTLTTKTLTTPTISKPVMSATNPTAETYTPSAAATATLDLALSNQHYITMPAGNITIALSNATNNQCFIISITQDGGGSRTVTWFSTIRWAGGVTPTLTTTASKRDTFGFIRTGSGTYDGFIVGQNI